ncbi:MAG: alpha-hydroxy acid oxidase [Tropicimonas sp.]|uniref:alpha-hydroxy acid oxidase n=1 Tax=Tropicimonas sp. TaxID=2067044 RepID=UPI003A8C4391
MSENANPGSVAVIERKKNATPRRLRSIYALHDFESRARRLLPKSIFGYVNGGVETDWSLHENRRSFQRYSFQPRILRDVSSRSAETALYGETLTTPIGIAPMGFCALAAFDGDVALARGAREAGSFAICSASSLTPLERVAQEGRTRWFQAYVPGDRNRIGNLIERVAAAGFTRLVITGDVPVSGNRENNARNGFDAPFRMTPQLIWQGITHPRWTLGTLGREILRRGMPHFENMESVQGPPLFASNVTRSRVARDKLSWDDIAFIRENWRGKLLVKGILHPDDALRAIDCGCDGIIVSNHGGRQLDGAISPLLALPQIRKAAPAFPLIYDSGVRRGTDIAKAYILGADFVLAGRPFLYAAATHGEEGVRHAMALLVGELLTTMALLGVSSIAELRDLELNACQPDDFSPLNR